MTNEVITLEEKLDCLVDVMGKQIGDVLRCIIQAEMQSHIARIEQLQAALDGVNCKKEILGSDPSMVSSTT
jgi:hypothetical protein